MGKPRSWRCKGGPATSEHRRLALYNLIPEYDGKIMLTATVQKEVDEALKLGERLEHIIVSKQQLRHGERSSLLIALWALSFDFHKGILSLVQAEFHGSAFALQRPVVEALIRSHVVIIGTDEEIALIQQDKFRVDFKTIGKRIDEASKLGDTVQKFLDVVRDGLHSYTHAGLLQLGRRFEGADLKPSYTDAEIVSVLRIMTTAVFMVTNLVTHHFGFEDERKNAGEMYVAWDKCRGN